MKKILNGALLAILALTLVAITSPAASAKTADVPGLRIGMIGYNAVGPDRLWNRNAEYIDVIASAQTDITDLVVQDAWRKATDAQTKPSCNIFKVTPDKVDASLKPGDGTKVILPARHTLRVYVGSGTPRAFGWGSRTHAVYMDHGQEDSKGCGYFGHFLNNVRDVVWIKLRGNEESKVYDFRRGYYVR